MAADRKLTAPERPTPRTAWVRLDPRDLRERASARHMLPFHDPEWDAICIVVGGVCYYALGGVAA